MTRRIGLLGGTFDPIHCGHLDLGAAAGDVLGLSQLLVIPAHTPPHRIQSAASAFHRFAMVALATADRRTWRASDVELLINEPSYTSSTLTRLHDEGYAPRELVFILGADAFAEVESWRNYPAILDAANFAVVSRPGHPVGTLADKLPALRSRVTTRDEWPTEGTRIFLIEAATADVSSTAIRQRRARGESIRDLVPHAVEQHIERHGLYAAATANADANADIQARAAGRLHGEDR